LSPKFILPNSHQAAIIVIQTLNLRFAELKCDPLVTKLPHRFWSIELPL
jgi:hypothetical protein